MAMKKKSDIIRYSYLLTPLLGQDMTQGQQLIGVVVRVFNPWSRHTKDFKNGT